MAADILPVGTRPTRLRPMFAPLGNEVVPQERVDAAPRSAHGTAGEWILHAASSEIFGAGTNSVLPSETTWGSPGRRYSDSRTRNGCFPASRRSRPYAHPA